MEGSEMDPKNYRTISLLSSTSKLLEKIFEKRLRQFRNQNEVIGDEQRGFRGKRSTLLLLNERLYVVLMAAVTIRRQLSRV
jgi:hypothetical protein